MRWIEAARIGRRPDGTLFCVEVFMQYGKPAALADAIERAKAGKTVFVERADASAVLDALKETVP